MEGLWLWGRRALAAAASGDRIAAAWAAVRARAVAPALEAAVWVCLAMSVMLVLEVCYMSVTSFVAVKLLRRVPERRYKWEPMPSASGGGKGDDEEAAAGGGQAYPMVLVQIPMYNEIEVRRFQLAFSPVCGLFSLSKSLASIRRFHFHMGHLAAHCFDSSSWECLLIFGLLEVNSTYYGTSIGSIAFT